VSSELLVHPPVEVTPESAGWTYVGFETVTLGGAGIERITGDRELCIVVVEGSATVSSRHGEWQLPGREDPWSGMPDAAYLPPETTVSVSGTGEIGLCWAPAPGGGAEARALPGAEITVETRGHGAQERFVRPILMGDREAESLLVVEVVTPAGHWSSYPPHKHDRDDPPRETLLEETYYHRVSPARGFGLQRVYSDDRSLDETITFGDRDCVLVPRGYHTVSAPPGYDLYYLNVMAGPTRSWVFANDPDHEWTAAG
jgi:5-deoxy-glucuronate isomerase